MRLDQLDRTALNTGVKHRRDSWPSGIYAQMFSVQSHSVFYLINPSREISAPYGISVEDFTADDWEITP